MTSARTGVRITRGPMDWQILQRRLDNKADVVLAGTWLWSGTTMAAVQVRVVVADEGRALPGFDWTDADTAPDRVWKAVLRDLPAGGPYRIETRLRPEISDFTPPGCLGGDVIQQVGVGDLWAVAGQSNASGRGRDPVEDPPDAGVSVFRHDDTWAMALHPLHDTTRSRRDPAVADGAVLGHSPFLAFAKRLRRALGVPIGLLPAALGGSVIAQWQPDGALYKQLLDIVRRASSWRRRNECDPADGGPVFEPRPAGPPGALAGVAWFQGENDAIAKERAAVYPDRFRRFVFALREEMGAPELPFVTCQLNRYLLAMPGQEDAWEEVRNAQRAASFDLPKVAVVPTLDLPLTDVVHLSAAANLTLAARMARSALACAYGVVEGEPSPDVDAVWFGDAARTEVLLRVRHVVGDLWSDAREITQFALRDDAGWVAVRKAELAGRDLIRLRANRPLGAGARVHNGRGREAAANVFDGERRPLLAFSGLPVGEAPT